MMILRKIRLEKDIQLIMTQKLKEHGFTLQLKR